MVTEERTDDVASTIKLPNSTPLQIEVAKRVRRGIKLLDKVTPGWFKPINPATLNISTRQLCVMAQAGHKFKEGIQQVALDAIKLKVPVRLMSEEFHLTGAYYAEIKRKDGSDVRPWVHDQFAEAFKEAKGNIIDVFYYGIAVDDQLRKLASDRSTYTAWAALTDAWKAVVVAKKNAKE